MRYIKERRGITRIIVRSERDLIKSNIRNMLKKGVRNSVRDIVVGTIGNTLLLLKLNNKITRRWVKWRE